MLVAALGVLALGAVRARDGRNGASVVVLSAALALVHLVALANEIVLADEVLLRDARRRREDGQRLRAAVRALRLREARA